MSNVVKRLENVVEKLHQSKGVDLERPREEYFRNLIDLEVNFRENHSEGDVDLANELDDIIGEVETLYDNDKLSKEERDQIRKIVKEACQSTTPP